MNKLSADWLTEGLMDFEYKRYQLLAYLKSVQQDFDSEKLYPMLADLVFHYRNLREVQDSKKLLSDSFKFRLSKADWEKLELSYEQIVEDDEMMKVLESIVYWALPKLKEALDLGKEIYHEVEQALTITPVGLRSLKNEEGLAFLWIEGTKNTDVYEYSLSVFTQSHEQFRALNMEHRGSYRRTIGQTPERLKVQMMKQLGYKYGHPATYLIHSRKAYPNKETLLPIAKRSLVGYLARSA